MNMRFAYSLNCRFRNRLFGWMYFDILRQSGWKLTLARETSALTGSRSLPIAGIPSFRAATNVVPEPTKGSYTIPACCSCSIRRASKAKLSENAGRKLLHVVEPALLRPLTFGDEMPESAPSSNDCSSNFSNCLRVTEERTTSALLVEVAPACRLSVPAE